MAEQKNSCTAVNTTKSCRGSVRFNDELIIHSTSTTHQESSSITWLTQNDYSNIQNGIFMTLHAMNMMAVNEEDNVSFYNPSFCSRGLEDYSTQDKGCLKNYVTTRRKEAVHAVLQEQESQRMEGLMCYYDDVSIREAYENNPHTLINTNNSISMGRNDSEEALKIYAEQHRSASPMPSQTQTQLQLQPPFSFSLSPKSVMNLFQNNNVHEKKWNFQQPQQQQQQQQQQHQDQDQKQYCIQY